MTTPKISFTLRSLLLLPLLLSLSALSIWASTDGGVSTQSSGQQSSNSGSSANKTSANSDGGKKDQSQGSQDKDITAGDKTGKMESYLLATAAVHQAAKKIADDVCAATPHSATQQSCTATGNIQIVLYDQREQDRLSALAQFRVQYSILNLSYSKALSPLPEDVQNLPGDVTPLSAQSITAIAGTVGDLAQAAVQLLSLFKTTTTTNGVDVTLNDEILIDEVAQALLAQKIKTLRPAIYFPPMFDEAKIGTSTIFKNMTTLFENKQSSLNLIASFQADIDRLNSALKKDPTRKNELNKYLQARVAKINQLKAVNLAFDSTMSSLMSNSSRSISQDDKKGTPGPTQSDDDTTSEDPSASGNSDAQCNDENNPSAPSDFTTQSTTRNYPGGGVGTQRQKQQENAGRPNSTTGGSKDQKQVNAPTDKLGNEQGAQGPTLSDLILADLLQDDIQNGKLPILTLHIQQSGGGYLTKSNIFTFFGGTVLYHMGGSVVSYSLLSSDSGDVMASGAVPVYGGFVKSSKVDATIKNLMK